MPLTTFSRSEEESSTAACVRASRPSSSGTHTVRQPNSSISRTDSCTSATGWNSKSKVESPNRFSSSPSTLPIAPPRHPRPPRQIEVSRLFDLKGRFDQPETGQS